MEDEYVLSARILHRRSKPLLDAFEAEFGPAGHGEVVRRALNLDIRRGYDPLLLAQAQVWAEAHEEELHVEESYTRTHSEAEIRAAPFCRLSFPPCELVPAEHDVSSCSLCGGHVETPSAHGPERIEFEQIGETGGRLYLSAAGGRRLETAGLRHGRLGPWSVDDSLWCLEPEHVFDELLVEGVNVLGLESAPCEECQRTACRFHLGPTILERSEKLRGLDVIGTRYLKFRSLAFSPRAASALLEAAPLAELWEPVLLS